MLCSCWLESFGLVVVLNLALAMAVVSLSACGGEYEKVYVDYFAPPGAPDVAGQDWIAIGRTCGAGTKGILYDAGGVCVWASAQVVHVKITTVNKSVDPLVEHRARKVAAEILLRGLVPRHLSDEQVCNVVWEASAELADRLKPVDLRTAGCAW